MGMTIDKCIEKITHEKQCFIDECWHNNGELEAYDMAIEIMRKYQKIVEIATKWKNETDPKIKFATGITKIIEVIEDGKIAGK